MLYEGRIRTWFFFLTVIFGSVSSFSGYGFGKVEIMSDRIHFFSRGSDYDLDSDPDPIFSLSRSGVTPHPDSH